MLAGAQLRQKLYQPLQPQPSEPEAFSLRWNRLFSVRRSCAASRRGGRPQQGQRLLDLRPDMNQMRTLLESVGSYGIVIAENNEAADPYLQQGFRGVVYRNVTGQALIECVRRVASGEKDQTARVRVCPAVTRFRLSMDHG